MKYIQYGVTLVRLREEDIEQVRQWRNSPHIVEAMEYREYITPEMQREWFKSIDNTENLYCIIEYGGEKIGLINGKNIDWQNAGGESGVFIADPKYYETFVPALVSFVVTDMVFRISGIETNYAHIMRTNPRAIQFNKSLGFELCEGQENVDNQLYALSRENFYKKTNKLRKAMQAMAPDKEPIRIIFTKEDLERESERGWQKIVEGFAAITKIGKTPDEIIYYFD